MGRGTAGSPAREPENLVPVRLDCRAATVLEGRALTHLCWNVSMAVMMKQPLDGVVHSLKKGGNSDRCSSRINLGCITPSEISQTQKGAYCVIALA